MKVLGVKSGVSATGKSEKKKSVGGGFSSYLGGADAVDSAVASETSAIGSVNSLFMLQEVEDEGYTSKKAVKYGSGILEYLEEIRVSLLTNSISPELVRKLDDMIKSWRDNITDPNLSSIIDDIELRAAVELAKLERL
ncbi:MAG: fliX [Rickettsiaceae bacterium]|jgi:hypothetical protein|nr:fliX [Rickettsiaceae bacterium]